MTWPTVTVEAAFATDPADTPTWTDISDYVRVISTNRGRQRELDKFMAGRCTIVAANADRRFDPTYTAGPYYPNVIPMRRIRVRATFAAVTYPLFYGFVDWWGQTYQGPAEALCEVSATDGFGFLANVELPSSVWVDTLQRNAHGKPPIWFRFSEPASAAQALNSGTLGPQVVATPTDWNPVLDDLPQFGVAGLVDHDPDTAVQFTNYAQVLTVTAPPGQLLGVTDTADFTIGFIVDIAADVGEIALLYTQGEPSVGPRVNVSVNSGTLGLAPLAFAMSDGTTTTTATTTGVNLTDFNRHRVVVTYVASTKRMRIYVDGVEVTSGSTTYAGGTIPKRPYLGIGGDAGLTNQGIGRYLGALDEFILWDTVSLDASDISTLNGAIANPWLGDTSGARLGRILDAAGWPAADRLIDTGQAILQSASLGGDALSALQKVAETERGLLFMDASGRVRFIDRLSVQKAPYTTSQATFGDSGSELDYEDPVIEPGSVMTVANDWSVSRTGGVVQPAEDATSIGRFLRRRGTLDGLLHQSDATSLDLANWMLARYKDPATRVTSMNVRPPIDEANLYPQVLGRELGDRLTFRKRPQNLGAAIEQDTQVEGIRHQIGDFHWLTGWGLSPAILATATSVWDQSLWDQGVWGF